jgi:hypothetical protein
MSDGAGLTFAFVVGLIKQVHVVAFRESQGGDDDSVWPALIVGLVAWATLSATTLLQHNAFELKPPKLTFLNNAYQLVLFLAMALVIGLM